jgi:putative Mg2+ transporter-C (MgtC) family protein
VDEITMCARIVLAALAGLVIGLEREALRKPAGMRTHLLVATAAAVLTTMSLLIGARLRQPGEALRVAAGVVTGIGFIGAGTILQTRSHVRGLTTAATVFMAAALGITIGSGLYAMAGTATVLTVAATWGLRLFERREPPAVEAERPHPRRLGRPAAPRRAPDA